MGTTSTASMPTPSSTAPRARALPLQQLGMYQAAAASPLGGNVLYAAYDPLLGAGGAQLAATQGLPGAGAVAGQLQGLQPGLLAVSGAGGGAGASIQPSGSPMSSLAGGAGLVQQQSGAGGGSRAGGADHHVQRPGLIKALYAASIFHNSV